MVACRQERKDLERKAHHDKQQTRKENIGQRQDAKKERQVAKVFHVHLGVFDTCGLIDDALQRQLDTFAVFVFGAPNSINV